MIQLENLLSVSEAATIAGVSTTQIRRLIGWGTLEAKSYGDRFYLISRPSFDRWMMERKPAGRPARKANHE